MAERGVEGSSMDAIAEASGVSKATIYKHWADKDALLLEMVNFRQLKQTASRTTLELTTSTFASEGQFLARCKITCAET